MNSPTFSAHNRHSTASPPQATRFPRVIGLAVFPSFSVVVRTAKIFAGTALLIPAKSC